MTTRRYRNDNRLQCFDHSLYIYTADETDRVCIAPTRSGARCSWDISEEELEEVVQLVSEAEGLEAGTERNAILQRLVLARVCGDTHRMKLEADPNCLRKVAEVYGNNIPVPCSEPRHRWQSPQTRQPERTPIPRSPSIMTNRSGQDRRRYLLRPRHAGLGGADPPHASSSTREQIFVPYPSDPNDHINDVLVSDIPQTEPRSGYVYIFTWPSSPGFVKIGYSKISAESRISAWQGCSPGAILLLSKPFAFPRRMERLIHLQMAQTRHQIIICKTCASTHLEWFKVSTDEAIQVISDWETVIKKEVLYNSTGTITESWRERISRTKVDLTAPVLLDLLEIEAKLLEKDTRESVPVQVVEADQPDETTSDVAVLVAGIDSPDPPSAEATVPMTTPEYSEQETQDRILSIFNDFMLMIALQDIKLVPVETQETVRGDLGMPLHQVGAITA